MVKHILRVAETILPMDGSFVLIQPRSYIIYNIYLNASIYYIHRVYIYIQIKYWIIYSHFLKVARPFHIK